MAKQNLNDPITPPAPQVDWSRVREEHGRPDQAAIQKFERTLRELDNTHETRGGRGRR